jgi:hypothetical protein
MHYLQVNYLMVSQIKLIRCLSFWDVFSHQKIVVEFKHKLSQHRIKNKIRIEQILFSKLRIQLEPKHQVSQQDLYQTLSYSKEVSQIYRDMGGILASCDLHATKKYSQHLLRPLQLFQIIPMLMQSRHNHSQVRFLYLIFSKHYTRHHLLLCLTD